MLALLTFDLIPVSLGCFLVSNFRRSSFSRPVGLLVHLCAAPRLDDQTESLTVAGMHCISNRKRVWVFEEDGAALRDVCSLHGIGGYLIDDVAYCFGWRWLTICFQDQCKKVIPSCMKIWFVLTRIVRYALDCILAHSTFYSTD